MVLPDLRFFEGREGYYPATTLASVDKIELKLTSSKSGNTRLGRSIPGNTRLDTLDDWQCADNDERSPT
jgi:hypothetical protein